MKVRKRFLLASAWGVVFSCSVGVQSQSFDFTAIRQLTNRETVISLSAPTGRAYRVESTATLPEWNGLVTFPTNATTSLVYTDSATPYLDSRYYRAVQLAEAKVVAGDHLVTTNGEVVIQPRNHATFVMQWNSLMIYADPVPAASYAGLPKADLILITHNHSDHFSTASVDAVKGPGAIIIAPQTVYNALTATQKTNAIVLGYGASTNLLGLTVEAVYAANGYHSPPGFGNGYVITLGGRRVYISGDTGNSTEIRGLTNIDVAFVCMNLPYTLTVSEATNVVRSMRPKIVYPYHYRDSDGSTANATVFKQRLGTDLGIEVRLRKWY